MAREAQALGEVVGGHDERGEFAVRDGGDEYVAVDAGAVWLDGCFGVFEAGLGAYERWGVRLRDERWDRGGYRLMSP